MIGLNTTLYKSLAFGLSACFVGAAGGVYAAWVHYIDPVRCVRHSLFGQADRDGVDGRPRFAARRGLSARSSTRARGGGLAQLRPDSYRRARRLDRHAAAVPAAWPDVAACRRASGGGRSMSEILHLSNVSRHFSGLQALREVTIRCQQGRGARPDRAERRRQDDAGQYHLRRHAGKLRHRHLRRQRHHGHRRRIRRRGVVCRARSRSCSHSPEFTALDNVAAAALFSQPGESLKSAREQARAHLAFVGLDAQAEQSAATLTLAMRKRLELAQKRWR